MNLIKLLLNTLIFSGVVSSQKCGRTLIRKEIREMSAYERKAFMNAVTKLYNNKPLKGSKLHKLDFFGWAHTQMYGEIHQQPSFYPWHRYFLQLFQLMILQVDPTVVIPYWDWTKDSQEPHKSPVLTDAFYGGNGNKDKSWAVENGFMKGWEMHFPNTHTMQRCYHKTINGTLVPDKELDPLPSAVLMNAVVNQYKTFSEFAWNAELYHGYVHILIGGDEGELGPTWSPNDLIFFLHHAYMDRLWWLWQKRNPDLARAYDGKFYDNPRVVSVNDILKVPGAPSMPVNATFDTLSWPFCYTYTEADDAKVMLNGEGDNSKVIVQDTGITKTNVDFDKIDTITNLAKKVQENPNETVVKPELKESLKVEEPKIKPINPEVPLKMMMLSNPQKVIDKIDAANKKVEALSSLKGFKESAIKR